MYRLPLFDHRVLDLTTTAAGAYATRMMGDLGAEVIMLEAAPRKAHGDLYVNKYGGNPIEASSVLKLAAISDIVVLDGDGPKFSDLEAVNAGVILISLHADGNAASAVAAVGALGVALWNRRRTGRGCHIELPSPPASANAIPPEAGTFEPVMSADGVREVRSPHWHLGETPLHVRLPAPGVGEHDDYVRKLLDSR